MVKHDAVRCGYLNICSAGNKTLLINELIRDEKFDLFIVTETWLSGMDSAKIREMTPNKYTFFHNPRRTHRSGIGGIGGGVGVFLGSRFRSIEVQKEQAFAAFEYMHIKFTTNMKPIQVLIVYRPPSLSKATFIDEFQILLESLDFIRHKIVLCGDFNLWVDVVDDHYSKVFLDLIDTYGLVNYVQGATSNGGHTLDLVIGHLESQSVSDVSVREGMNISDHELITFGITEPKPGRISKNVMFRGHKNFCASTFIHSCYELINTRIVRPCNCTTFNPEMGRCVTCLTAAYRRDFNEMYDMICPQYEKPVIERDFCPWFTTEVKVARAKRRAAEAKWKRRDDEVSRQEYVRERNNVTKLVKKTKVTFYKSGIKAAGSDPKRLYGFLNDLLGKVQVPVLPDCLNETLLAINFCNKFEDKVERIFCSTQPPADFVVPHYSPDVPYRKFLNFKEIDLDTLKRHFMSCNFTNCANDPFPISRVACADNIDLLLTILLDIVNCSLSTGVFAQSEKLAFIRPLLKNLLDPQNLDAYRPVSNVSFLSKLEESVAKEQLVEHLDSIDILPTVQSAYRRHYSTETALLAVYNDVLHNFDCGRATILVLIDLSSAFDTVVHDILIDDLILAGIDGTALSWFRSYLSERSFRVQIGSGNAVSDSKPLKRGVPQGSILGPILFSVYVIELYWLLRDHGVECMFFADDTQFYFQVNDPNDIQPKFDTIMQAISDLMMKKRLKLNVFKTQVIKLGTLTRLQDLLSLESLTSGDNEVTFSTSVKNLGVIFDERFTFESHVNAVVKKCHFHLSNIKFIKPYVNKSNTMTLIHSLVLNRVDYCNSLLVGTRKQGLHKLQGVLHRAARIVTGCMFREHITSIMISLHWLPIIARIKFKLCLITFKTLKHRKPEYLFKHLERSSTGHVMRTRTDSDQHHLTTHRVSITLAERAFSYAAPRLYNELPHEVKNTTSVITFKKLLKSHYFRDCYDILNGTLNIEYKV